MNLEKSIADPLNEKSSFFRVECPENVETGGQITSIRVCVAPTWKKVLRFTSYVCTGFLMFLLNVWISKLHVAMTYTEATIDKAEFIVVYGEDKKTEIVPLITEEMTKKSIKVFIYRFFKYFFDEETRTFKPAQFHIEKKTCHEIHKDLSSGLEESSVNDNGVFYGKNQTDIPKRSCFSLLFQEILNPFYVFQVFSCIIWILDQYVAYALIIFIFSFGSVILTLVETIKITNKLREMSFYEIVVEVIRVQNGSKIKLSVSSVELVPGDLLVIPEGVAMPCDAILLNGTCIMNEAMLTGESIPVVKNPLPKLDSLYSLKEHKQYTLFAGTKCIQAKFNEGTAVLGLVTLTGFSTMKGELIRTMLFPQQSDFKFYSDSFKFIGILFLLAVAGFFVTLPSFLRELEKDPEVLGTILIKAAEIVTITVPPALPTCMNVGISVALSRLKKKSTFCIAPSRINETGRVSVMCFDKTGTLTEEGLDLLGVRPSFFHNPLKKLSFAKLVSDISKLQPHISIDTREKELKNYISIQDQLQQPNPLFSTTRMFPSEHLLESMATCHSLGRVQGSLVGDPLDIKMFESTNWEYEENENKKYDAKILAVAKSPSKHEIRILKRFEFSSKLQRMSVVVSNRDESQLRMHIKGSPEKVREFCDPASVPDNFHSVLQKYTEDGFRVLACATKVIQSDLETVMSTTREDLERDFAFTGFLIMENKLKPVTTQIIDNLQSAEVKTIMVTGDNVLTAISVARQCKIIHQYQKIFLGDLSETKINNEYVITWKDFEFSGNKLNEELEPELEYGKGALRGSDLSTSPLKRKSTAKTMVELAVREKGNEASNEESNFEDNLVDLDPPFFDILHHDYCIAITGRAFSRILEEVQLSQDQKYQRILVKLLSKCVVYARMQPDEKALMVKHLMKNAKNIVGMCGDGANDVAALKAAHVGVSLSEAEASIAAPFTSKIQDISCIPNLLLEGKSALATSYQAFKYMALYSVIQSTSVTILYASIIEFTNTHYYHIDLGIIIPMCAAMAFSATSEKLTKYRPTGRLVSVQILTSVLGQSAIQIAFQTIAFFVLLHRFGPGLPDSEKSFNDQKPTLENTILYLVSIYQYVAVALAFLVGRPFRKSFYTNFYFTGLLIFCLALNAVVTFDPFKWEFMYAQEPKDDYLMYRTIVHLKPDCPLAIFKIAVVNTIMTLIWERIVVRLVAIKWKEHRDEKERERRSSLIHYQESDESKFNQSRYDQAVL